MPQQSCWRFSAVCRALTALLATSLSLAAPAQVAKPEEFCARLATVITAATTNFATLRGKGSAAKGWEATMALPGMHPCSIDTAISDDSAPFTYRCTVADNVEAIIATARREEAKQLISRCLGGSWQVQELPHAHHVTDFFSNKASPLTLQVYQWEGTRGYMVTLTVDAPLPPLTLRRSRTDGAIGLDSPVDFKAEKAGIGNVAGAFRDLLGADLFIDIDLTGKVKLDLKNVPVHEALDAVCAQVGCTWSFKTKPKGRPELHVQKR